MLCKLQRNQPEPAKNQDSITMTAQTSRFQPAVLLQAAGNNRDTFIHLLNTFLRIGPEIIQKMESAFKNKDSHELAKHLHYLKNCINLLGVTEQGAVLGSLESMAKKNEFVFDVDNFDALVRSMQKIINDVSLYLEANTAQMFIPRP